MAVRRAKTDASTFARTGGATAGGMSDIAHGPFSAGFCRIAAARHDFSDVTCDERSACCRASRNREDILLAEVDFAPISVRMACGIASRKLPRGIRNGWNAGGLAGWPSEGCREPRRTVLDLACTRRHDPPLFIFFALSQIGKAAEELNTRADSSR